MIKIIGLSKAVYNDILTNHKSMVKNHIDNCYMIEFIVDCCLEINDDRSVFIQCGKNAIDFLWCDYWRIEVS